MVVMVVVTIEKPALDEICSASRLENNEEGLKTIVRQKGKTIVRPMKGLIRTHCLIATSTISSYSWTCYDSPCGLVIVDILRPGQLQAESLW
jgi:hypothetical protein